MRKKFILIVMMCVLCAPYSGSLVMGSDTRQETVKESDIGIVVKSTVDDTVFLFLRTPQGEATDFTYQIGTSACQIEKAEALTKQDVAMKTLVLMDNSFSITKTNRSKAKQMLLEMIAEKKDNELVRIATFDQQIHYLTDYESDYTVLKKAVQSVQYHDQETYLTDVLYTLLDNGFGSDDTTYNRIIVISDGVDNKALGYTKEELYSKLTENTVPIYTFGCNNGKNTEQLKNMFAVARASQAKYYVLDQIKDVTVPVQELARDRDILRIEVKPQDDLLDGSVKNSKLTFKVNNNTYTATADVKMPFKIKEEVPDTTTPEVQETVQPDEMADTQVKKKEIDKRIIWIGGGVGAVLIIGGCIWLLLKKRKERTAFEMIVNEQPIPGEMDEPEEPTEVAASENQVEMTNRIWDEPLTKTLTLTDIKSPSKTFQVPIVDSVIIGRSYKQSNLVIDYDRSVSAKHCEIKIHRDNRVFISDLQSSNGTYVNGSRVLTEIEISSGATLKLGRLEFKFEIR